MVGVLGIRGNGSFISWHTYHSGHAQLLVDYFSVVDCGFRVVGGLVWVVGLACHHLVGCIV